MSFIKIESKNINSNEQQTMELIEEEAMDATDDEDDSSHDDGSNYDEAPNLMDVAMENEVTAQLVAAGVVGVAAAAAITSSKKKKRPHSFETNPSIRKRQQNRLLRKLRQTIYEYATRVGQQAVVLVATPGKPNNIYKVFGAKPLEDVMKNLRSLVMDELETALAQQAPPRVQEDPSLFELPPLIIDGIPTPVEKMTQAQLRAFIPLMLKYSTGRGKPGWGRDSTRPPWWPKELPWANVRMDARTEEEKQKISWTHALRKIVLNCYKYHGREDLLPAFSEEDEKANAVAIANSNVNVIKINNSSNCTSGNTTYEISETHENTMGNQTKLHIQTTSGSENVGNTQVCLDSLGFNEVDYTPTVLQTIQNSDGTVSIIQMDSNNPIITLPDGTTAQVQGVATLHTQNEDGHTVQSISDGNGGENVSLDLSDATLAQDGQLIITGDDGYPVAVSGMITLPVSAQMYQTVVANIQQLHQNADGTVCLTPVQIDGNDGTMETITIPSGMHQMMIQGPNNEAQVLQVLSIKDVSKAMSSITELKSSDDL